MDDYSEEEQEDQEDGQEDEMDDLQKGFLLPHSF
jgi:hypothetical protein